MKNYATRIGAALVIFFGLYLARPRRIPGA